MSITKKCGLVSSRNLVWVSTALLALSLPVLKVGAAPLKVAMMPSYAQQVTYANAALNESITVWGRTWDGVSPYTYTMDFGDGTAASGTVSTASFINNTHTYSSSGSKTVVMKITDSVGSNVTRQAVIRVIPAPTHAQRVNMAIEKGLLWLYRNQVTLDADRIYWQSSSDEYGLGSVGAALAAFEENGHLPSYDYEQDIYAETVKRGMNWLVNNSMGAYYDITTQHTDGIAVRNCDSNGNGKGIYLKNGSHATYATAFGAIALVLSQPDFQTATNTFVAAGTFAGKSIYEVAMDICDQFAFCQGDGANRGGWQYVMDGTDNILDGSAQQWACLLFLTAKERWGISPPAWVVDNAIFGFDALLNVSGGVGYGSSSSWTTPGKSGGYLSACYLAGRSVTNNSNAQLARNYIGTNWYSAPGWGPSETGWAGDFYSMYGIKKGLMFQGVETLTTPTGSRNWYSDMSAWLLGNAEGGAWALAGHPYIPTTMNSSIQTTANAFGQGADGSWATAQSPIGGYAALSTAHGVLVLTKAVTKPLPVPIIAPVLPQSIRSIPFTLDASGSYHQNSGATIVEYLWDFNAADGLNWTTPDASGLRPTHPGFSAICTNTITLRVQDNSNPTNTATATMEVIATDMDLPPVAIAIPPGRYAYSARVGEQITLDGSASYDPDDDAITNYIWDLNGNSIYGDANDITTTNAITTIIFSNSFVGAVGLKVTAKGVSATSQSQVDVFSSSNDLRVASLVVPSFVPGVSADLSVTLVNDAASQSAFENVLVRFFNGHPLFSGVQISSNQLVNLAKGVPYTLNTTLNGLSGISLTNVYVFVDANNSIPEWSEENNVMASSTNLTRTLFLVGTNGVVVSNGVAPLVVAATDFGSKVIGSGPLTNFFSLTNEGNCSVTLSNITPSGVGAAAFALINPPSVVAPYSAASFTVVFSPIAGQQDVTYAIVHDATNVPFVINLTAVGNAGNLVLSSAHLDFAAVFNGTNPVLQMVGVTNKGSATIALTNTTTYGAGPTGWLSVSPATGMLALDAALGMSNQVDMTGFNAGTYLATNIITAPVASNAPQSVTVSLVVDKANQAITFAPIDDQFQTNTLTLSATAGSGLPVIFTVDSGPAVISNGTSLSFTGVGDVSIVASQPGNSNWNVAASVTNTFVAYAVIWVSTPVTNGVYNTPYRYDLYAYDRQALRDVTYSGASLPAWLSITNLDLIDTVAGTGTVGWAGDSGQATNAQLHFAANVAMGVSNTWVIADTENNRIRKVDAQGVISTLVGTGSFGFSGDGAAAVDATLGWPEGVAVDLQGNVYISDTENQRIRKVSTGGVITTIAGTGTAGVMGDGGPATNAQLNFPKSLAVDRVGNVYVADSENNRIRKIATNGVMTTLAGNGIYDFGGDGGPATNASLQAPSGVAVDQAGNVYIADRYNNRIRKVDLSGIITTVAGNGDFGYSGDGGLATNAVLNAPYSVAVDSIGRIYVSDTENARIRRVSTNGVITALAGDGNFGYFGDGGLATAARLDSPHGVAVDLSGRLYVADYNNMRIRRVSPRAGILWGTPPAAGNYDITLWASDGNSSNSQSFRIFVDKTPATVTFGNLTQAYNGSGHSVSVSTIPPDLTVSVTYAGNVWAPTNAGSYAVTGTVSDANYQGIGAGTLVINKAGQVISFDPIGDQETTNQVGLMAVASSALGVSWAVQSGPAVITGSTNLTFTNSGPVTIVGSQAGNANWDGATDMIYSFNVTKAFAGVTLTNLNQTYNGTPRSAGALSVPSVSAVQFTYDGLSAAPTNAGSYTVIGVVNDAMYQGSQTGMLVVAKAAASVNLLDLAQTYNGSGCSATATTTPAGLTVTFTYDGLSGAPTNAGSYAVTGTVSAANWQGESGGTLTISKAAQTISFNEISDQLATNHVGLAATADSGLGVSFAVSSGSASINEDTNLTFSSFGPVSVVASQAGDNNWNPAIPVTNLFNVNRVSQTVVFTAPVAPLDQTLTCTVAAAASSGLAVTNFSVVSGPGVVNGAQLTFTNGGYVILCALQDGNGSWNTASATTKLYIAGVPLWVSPPVTTATCLQVYSYIPEAVDVDSPGLFYSADTLPGWLSLTTYTNYRIIDTYAGTGTAGYNGDSQSAVDAQLKYPAGLFRDESGLYVADQYNHRVRHIDAFGTITTIAGDGTAGIGGGDGDGGAATNAQLRYPTAVARDAAGNLYIADRDNNRVRKVDVNGVITAFAGTGVAGITGDGGSATNARLRFPSGLAVDSLGNVFIADRDNHRVRKVDTNGVITTVVGTSSGYSGDGEAATSARLRNPVGLAFNAAGVLYIADQNNNVIRRVEAGIITTVVGTGTIGYNGNEIAATNAMLAKPSGVGFDPDGNLYIADTDNHQIRWVDSSGTIHALAGLTNSGYSGDGGPATNAALYAPFSVVVQEAGVVALSDYNNQRIRYIGLPLRGLTGIPPTGGVFEITLWASDGVHSNRQTFMLTVEKVVVPVHLQGLSQTYNGLPQSSSATTDVVGLAVEFTYDGNTAAPTNAGTYTVIGTINDPTYQGVSTGTLTIAAAALTVIADADSKIYGETKTYGAGQAAFTSAGLQNGETIGTVTITADGGTASNANVGTYTLTPSLAVDGTFSLSNYEVTYSNGTLTVGAAALTVIADADSKTYGGSKTYGAGQTAFTSVGLQNGETIGTVTIAADGGTASNASVGAYTLTPSLAVGGTFALSNYDVTYSNGTLTVGVAALTVIADADSKTYGATKTYGAGQTAFTSAGLQNGETIGTVTITADGGTASNANVGTYALTPSLAVGGTFALSNYEVTYSNGTLTVGAAALIVIADDDSKTYGATKTYGAGQTAFTSAGLQNGETIGTVTITADGGTASNANVGTYTLTPSLAVGGSFLVSNYEVTYSNGTLTVEAAALTVIADADNKTYGATKIYGAGQTAFTSVGLQNGETIGSVTIAADGGTASNANVGTYTLTPSLAVDGTFSLSNYDVTYSNGTLTVGAASLTVVADADSKTYGATKTYGAGQTAFTSVGLQNGETIGTVTITADGGTASNANVGTYTLTPSLAVDGTFALSNYEVTYSNGTLTVGAAALTVIADADSKIYGETKTYGAGQTAFTSAGLQNGETIGTVTITADGGTASNANVGTYTLTPSLAVDGTFALSNYEVTYSNGTLTVGAAALTVIADADSKIYGETKTYGAGQTAFTSVGLQNGETIGTVTITADGGTASNANVGTYTLSPSLAVGGSFSLSNYDVTYSNGTLTVGAAALTVIADADSKIYGATKTYGAGQTAFTSVGLQNGEAIGTVTITADGGTASNASVGAYTLTPSLAVGGSFSLSNYDVTYSNGTLTVGGAALTVIADADSKTYGATKTYGEGQTAFTSVGLQNGEAIGTVTITADGGTAANADVGTYTLTPSLAVGGTFALSNYEVTYSNGTLTVGAAALTVIADADSKIYGETKTYGAGQTAFTSSGLQNGETIGTVTITASGGAAANADVGTYTLTPSLAVGGSFSVSNYSLTYSNGTLTVNKADQVITSFTPGDRPFVLGASTTLVATASSGLMVSYSNLTPGVSVMAGSSVTFTNPGLARIKASQAGDGNWNAAADVTRTWCIGSLITNVTPAVVNVGGRKQILVQGIWLGNGSDITNVTLAGVQASIITQTISSVTVLAGAAEGPVTGSVTVASGIGGLTVLSNSFIYQQFDAPTLLDPVSITSSNMQALWLPPAGAESCILEVGLDTNFTAYLPGYQGLGVALVNSYPVGGLQEGSWYAIRTYAVNSNGYSLPSRTAWVLAGTNTAYAVNPPPGGILALGSILDLPLSNMFFGQGLVYSVASSDTNVVEASVVAGNQLRLVPHAAGRATITVRATNPQTGYVASISFEITVDSAPAGVSAGFSSRMPWDPYFKQTLKLHNDSAVDAVGVRVLFSNLMPGISITNRTGTSLDGRVMIEMIAPFQAGTTTDVTVVYLCGGAYKIDQYPATIEAQYILPAWSSPVPDEALQLNLAGSLTDGSGRFRIGYPSVIGGIYVVEYMNDFPHGIWIEGSPKLRATGTRVEWVDAGPPATLPVSGVRVYRVKQFDHF